jgi:hypothetical protein
MTSASSSSLSFGAGVVRLSTGLPIAMKNSSCPAGVHMQSTRARPFDVLEEVRRVRRNVDGHAGLDHRLLATDSELDLALEQREHLFEVVPVRAGPPAMGTCMSIRQ